MRRVLYLWVPHLHTSVERGLAGWARPSYVWARRREATGDWRPVGAPIRGQGLLAAGMAGRGDDLFPLCYNRVARFPGEGRFRGKAHAVDD